MNKKERVRWIVKVLEELYPNPPIPLHHKDAYTLLIAVLLSAQCTDARVNMVTPGLFALADRPEMMAKIPVEKVEEAIRTCGLAPRKARAIVELSQILIDKFDGKVPDTLEELETLPGVGHKTASVVMIQAFGKVAFPVDTHIHRLAERWKLSNGSSVDKTERDLKKVFPKSLWAKLHLQMIYFGREYCPARQHNPDSCPICSRIFC